MMERRCSSVPSLGLEDLVTHSFVEPHFLRECRSVRNPYGHALQVTGHCASTPLSHCCCARTGLITKNCANKVQLGTRSWHAVVVVVVVVVVLAVTTTAFWGWEGGFQCELFFYVNCSICSLCSSIKDEND